ncbi:MAG: RpiB/LacA/LacB family sugar-phosphate isomerase [Coriobacteriia bacterium]|nr:RpiB/LacA/LacB family sugar-phosphate isomerase [Coriobacteriia bacterium]
MVRAQSAIFQRIVLGSDHAGYPQKARLVDYLREHGYEVLDVGPDNETDAVDYPDYAVHACKPVCATDEHAADNTDVDTCAILVCGTGIGMAITANKLAGIRAANITTPEFAVLCREHNDANVLTLSGRFVDYDTNVAIVEAFLGTPYAGARHQHRLDKITRLEQIS